MNKQGHIYVSSKILTPKMRINKFWFLFGSILPDIFLFTYAEGHLFDTTFEKICRCMQQLGQRGKLDGYSSLKLGYLLHYVEDYFTHPHNNNYKGTLADHIVYEKQLSDVLSAQDKKETEDAGYGAAMSAETLCDHLNEMHGRYMEQEPDFENDRKYILEAAGLMVNCFSALFERNQRFAEMPQEESPYLWQGTFMMRK